MTNEETRKFMEAWWNDLKAKGHFVGFDSYSDWELRHGRNPDEELKKDIVKAEKEYKDGKAVDLKDVLDKELKDPEFKKDWDNVPVIGNKIHYYGETLPEPEKSDYYKIFGKDDLDNPIKFSTTPP